LDFSLSWRVTLGRHRNSTFAIDLHRDNSGKKNDRVKKSENANLPRDQVPSTDHEAGDHGFLAHVFA
jgi:hypothetical protein